MDLAGISLAETNGQVFLRHQPVEARAPIDADQLHALLHESGFKGCQYLEMAILQAAQDCNTVAQPFVVQVATRLDAAIEVRVAADDMSAQFSLIPPQGGKPASMEGVLQALAGMGVVFGIDQAALAQAVAQGNANQILLARGVAPQNGTDTAFESLIPDASDRAPKLDANGLIDYREHGGIVLVTAGQALMRRTPPTPGVAGHTIRGRELPPRAGLDLGFAASLAGTQPAPDDANVLQATVSGQPVLVDRGVMVEPVLRLKEVNMASGNIYFDGTVQVDGEVMQGMKIQASGDIVVGGTVDGGLLEAGGNIHIAGGVIAQAKVRAGGAVAARFAENSSITAATVIALADMALQCELESLNQIMVGDKVPQRGRLVGGSATAMMLLRVPWLGSNNGGITKVKLGSNSVLEAELKTLELRLEKEKTAEEGLQKLVKQLGANGDPKGLLERAKASWRQAVQIWSKSLAERSVLQQKLALAHLAKVEVRAGVDGPVDLAFGSRVAYLRSEIGPGVFSYAPATGLVHTNAAGRVANIPFVERNS